ncbi:MAG: hypothetical protein V7641_302 [Blastocatellia bacterium]
MSLSIMFLSVDTAARAILAPVQAPTLSLGHCAVSFCGSLCGFRPGLLSFEPSGFPSVQLAAAHALTDAPLLVTLAPVNSRCGLRKSRDTHAEHKNSSQYHANDLLHAVLLQELNFSCWCKADDQRLINRAAKIIW